jgi:DNA-binding MarR family transcriptional regulator
MHPFFFAMKRAYYATLRWSRGWLKPLGMTPARLDLLLLIAGEGGAQEQAWLVRAVGVTRSVLSRMISRMVELGLLKKNRHPMDRRRNFIWLTPRSKELLETIEEEVLKWRVTDLALASILAPRSWFDAAKVDAALGRLERPLWNLRRELGDVSARRFGSDPWGRY